MSSTDGTIALKDGALEKWLGGHHIVVTDSDKRDGVEYHAFVIGGNPVAGPKERYDFQADIPIGPIILQLVGFIDTSTLDADITLYVKVPLLPAIKVAEVKGNLRDGIIFTINIPGVASGSVKVYIADDKWLHVKFTLTIFGQECSADLALFKIPWL
ncbi:hypothetical protein C8T65DRAFT_744934 [Cerioporus squamosus]|nr:hypothetical protein C8T65DRAFT_744934 [Cerioporus squamosus]